MNPWKAVGPVIVVLATVAGCAPDVVQGRTKGERFALIASTLRQP
jgi:hypothetical protein